MPPDTKPPHDEEPPSVGDLGDPKVRRGLGQLMAALLATKAESLGQFRKRRRRLRDVRERDLDALYELLVHLAEALHVRDPEKWSQVRAALALLDGHTRTTGEMTDLEPNVDLEQAEGIEDVEVDDVEDLDDDDVDDVEAAEADAVASGTDSVDVDAPAIAPTDEADAMVDSGPATMRPIAKTTLIFDDVDELSDSIDNSLDDADEDDYPTVPPPAPNRSWEQSAAPAAAAAVQPPTWGAYAPGSLPQNSLSQNPAHAKTSNSYPPAPQGFGGASPPVPPAHSSAGATLMGAPHGGSPMVSNSSGGMRLGASIDDLTPTGARHPVASMRDDADRDTAELSLASRAHALTLTLDQYAALCAERDTFPDRTRHVERAFDIFDAAGRQAVDNLFHKRFAQHPSLRQRWEDEYRRVTATLQHLFT